MHDKKHTPPPPAPAPVLLSPPTLSACGVFTYVNSTYTFYLTPPPPPPPPPPPSPPPPTPQPQEQVRARERSVSRNKFLQRARKAEERGELRDAQHKRQVSQRKVLRVLEVREKDKAARNIQVRLAAAVRRKRFRSPKC